MPSPPYGLAPHLLAAASMPIAVTGALAGIWFLPNGLPLTALTQTLIRAVVPVLGAVTITMYGIYLIATLRIYFGPRSSSGVLNPGPDLPLDLERVTRTFWTSVFGAVGLFLLLLGVAWGLGIPSHIGRPDRALHAVFFWLERGTIFSNAAIFVFAVALTTTYGLRGVVRTYHFEVRGARRIERRRNLPLEVGVGALPIFVTILWMQNPSP
jgi:hypothetical protein